ncbi:hypothetical protein EYF80_046305 [Liparis tanakae]|uniref:Uncharacterized protein n=1 Tax=Liparis tanakae TaxID=230148 RepID=A0A4Z2FQK3_9TELE|nr:hypothetical protein EYF80_046305 [Liparis tanakae]
MEKETSPRSLYRGQSDRTWLGATGVERRGRGASPALRTAAKETANCRPTVKLIELVIRGAASGDRRPARGGERASAPTLAGTPARRRPDGAPQRAWLREQSAHRPSRRGR